METEELHWPGTRLLCGLLWDQRYVWVVPIVLPSAWAMLGLRSLATHMASCTHRCKQTMMQCIVLCYGNAEAGTHF